MELLNPVHKPERVVYSSGHSGTNMKIPGKRTFILVAISVCLVLAVAAVVVRWRVSRAIRGAEQALVSEQNLRYEARPYSPNTDSGFETVSAPAVFTQAAEFQGHLFVAGPAGLSEFDERGRLVREFHVGQELPSSPLVRLAVSNLSNSREPELIVATADTGLLIFNGSNFKLIQAQDGAARTTTAILPTASGRLLIGTAERGVLVYDGRRFGPFHPSLSGLNVTELFGTDADLWVGTADRGVGHWHGGAVEWFDESNGLPDSHIYGIAQQGARTFVGTSTGIAEFENGKFVRVLAAGSFVRSLLAGEKTLFAGTMDDGILEIPLAQTSRNAVEHRSIGNLNEVEQLIRSNGSLYALTSSGVYLRRAAGSWSRVLVSPSALLTDRNISSLALDSSGRLWVGYFDRGLDILDSSKQHVTHLEDEHIFCINRISPSRPRNTTAVATANGLVLFDSQGGRKQILTKTDGLIADHVTDVAIFGDDLVAATPAGLTFVGPSGIRSLYAFHGLVNNHVYALAPNGNTLLAGTLGGVSLLQNDRVRVSLTTATSKLKANWITAALPDEAGWWVGTYGAGIAHIDSTGHIELADGASGDLVINSGAMISTGQFVAAGTMGHGLYLLNRSTNHWSAITNGLPSLNVTALARGSGFLYVGTDNGLVRIPEQRLGR